MREPERGVYMCVCVCGSFRAPFSYVSIEIELKKHDMYFARRSVRMKEIAKCETCVDVLWCDL